MEFGAPEALRLAMMFLMAVGLSACVGLRAMIPPFAVAVLARMDYVRLNEHFDWLSSWPAIVVLGLAMALEIAADKFPVVDNLLDTVEIYAKPVVAVLVSAAVVAEIQDPILLLVVSLAVGIPVAGIVQIGSMTLRAASTAVTGGLGSPAVSTAEDAASAGGTLLVIFIPILALAIVAAMVMGYVWWRRRRTRRT